MRRKKMTEILWEKSVRKMSDEQILKHAGIQVEKARGSSIQCASVSDSPELDNMDFLSEVSYGIRRGLRRYRGRLIEVEYLQREIERCRDHLRWNAAVARVIGDDELADVIEEQLSRESVDE